MEALISLLVIIFTSIVINKFAAAALTRTGLSRDVASFQAASAFSGVGFTTSESEYVVSHPVRRRIIKTLMLLGSAGFSSAVATLILAFLGRTAAQAAWRLLWLGVGLLFLYWFATSPLVDRVLGRIIEWSLDRFTDIRVVDYESLLGIARGYIVSSFRVSEGSWLAGKTLREAGLREEGAVVLGIYRRGRDGVMRYIGAPRPDTRILAGDELIVYGPEEVISRLSRRLQGIEGDREHEEMVAEQARRLARERLIEEEATAPQVEG